MNENKSINSLKKQLVAAVAMVCVAAVALGSSTYAWFVSNNKVSAELSNVSATAASASLYIEHGHFSTIPTGNKTSDTVSSALTLVPVSNNYSSGKLGDWYIVNSWKDTTANGYANLNQDAAYAYEESTSGGTLTGATIQVSANEKARVGAYTVGEYTLYTKTGEQDIYLAPDAIKVTEGRLTNGDAHLTDAIRIAIVATNGSSSKTLYYLPTAETSKGNDDKAEDGKVYGVNSRSSIAEISAGSETVAEGYFIPDTLKYWEAQSVGNGSYTTGNDTKYKLGTAGNTPDKMLNVKVYVWLEGTDGQCLINQGVDGVEGLGVAVDFVGVESTVANAGN